MSIEITASTTDHPAERSVPQAIMTGARLHCPNCCKGNLFGKYLKVAESCTTCGEEFYHHRADDAPAYFTMLIVGHIVVAGVLAVEIEFAPPLWVHGLLWGPLLLLMSLFLLPRIKGAIVGLQWALRMHGFAGPGSKDPSDPDEVTVAKTSPTT